MELVILAVAALLTRVGQAMYGAGLSRSKNSAGAVVRAVCDLCVAALAFWAVGAALLFQEHNGFFGVRPGRLLGWSGTDGRLLLGLSLVLISTGAVASAVAERSKFFALCGASAALAGLVIPVAGRWAWGGWLGNLGFIDGAGASVLHLTAGIFAAVGAVLVGPRQGKYNRDGSANVFPGHSVPLAATGVLVMLAGFVAYAPAASAAFSPRLAGHVDFTAAVAANVLLAGAAGGLAGLLFGHFRYGKPDVVLTLLGLLGGVVSATAGAASFGTLAAVITGAVAGLIVPLSAVALDLLWHVDDPGGAVSVHGVAAAWGLLAAGLFAPGSFAERLRHLGVQALGLLAVGTLAAAVAFAVFAALKATAGLRSKEADEFDGLDLAEHDIGAYPDFQQTMIKSYHLREA